MHKLISSGLLIGLLALWAPAYAQVDVEVGGGVDGSAGSEDTSLPVDAETGIYVGSDSAEDTGEPADGSGEADPNTAGETGVSLTLSAKEAASASLDAESATLSSEAVVTSDDLTAFATAQMKRDENIHKVKATDEGVSLTYRLPARLLGLIPTHLKVTGHVSASGEATIDYPWYRFLFAVESADAAEAQLLANVAGMTMNGTLTTTAQAELLDSIHAAFAGTVLAPATADVGVTADMAGNVDEIDVDASGAAGGTFEAGSPEAEAAADDPDAIAQ